MENEKISNPWNSISKWKFTKVLKKLVDYGDVFYYKIWFEVPRDSKRVSTYLDRILFFYKYASSLFEIVWINHRLKDTAVEERFYILLGIRGWRNPEYCLQLLNDLHYDWRRLFFELDVPSLSSHVFATARGFGYFEIAYIQTRKELRGLIFDEDHVTLNKGANFFFGGYLFYYTMWDYATQRDFFNLQRCGAWQLYYSREYFVSKHDAACEGKKMYNFIEEWTKKRGWWLYGGWVWKLISRTGGYKKLFHQRRLIDVILRNFRKVTGSSLLNSDVSNINAAAVQREEQLCDLRIRMWFEGAFYLRQEFTAFFPVYDKRVEKRKTIKIHRRYLFFSNGVYDAYLAFFHIILIDTLAVSKEKFHIHMASLSPYAGPLWSPNYWKNSLLCLLPPDQEFEEYFCPRINELRKRLRFFTPCVYITATKYINCAFLILKLLQVLEGGSERNPHNLKILDFYALCNRIKIVSTLPNDFRGTLRLGAYLCVYESPAVRQHMYKHLVPYKSTDGIELFGYYQYLVFQQRFRRTEAVLGEQLLNFLAYCSGSEHSRLPRIRSPWDRVIRISNEKPRPEEAVGSYANPLKESPRFFSDKKKKV